MSYPSGQTVHLLQPVTGRTVYVAGKKLVTFQRSKNSSYVRCSANQLCIPQGLYPVFIPAQKSPLSVDSNFMNSNSSTNKNSIPLLALTNPNTSLSKDFHSLLESSAVKPVQASEFSTNSTNQTIKIKRFLPGACATIPNKLRKLSCDLVSDKDVPTTSSFPKLSVMTQTTQTDSTASHVLKPEVVNTIQNKPIVSFQNSNAHTTTLVPKQLESSPSFPIVIPFARKASSATLKNIKKNSTFCIRTGVSENKLITTDVKSVESESVNLNMASSVSAKRLFMVDVKGSGRSSDMPCSSNSVSSGNCIESKVTDKQPTVADVAVTSNSGEDSEICQKDSTSNVRILDDKSETGISNRETSVKKSQKGSISGVITSDEKKSHDDLPSIGLSSEKSQCDLSGGKTSNEKLQSNCVYSVRSSARKTMDKSATALQKRESSNTPSPRSKCKKAQEESRSTVKRTVRAASKRKRTKSQVDKMVTRSSSRRKLVLCKFRSCT